MVRNIESVKRPNCAVCSGTIPNDLLSAKDVQAEYEYAAKARQPMRDFYCSAACGREAYKFERIFHGRAASSPSCPGPHTHGGFGTLGDAPGSTRTGTAND